jgi:uncharacterized protein YsxB (DUF464 family)
MILVKIYKTKNNVIYGIKVKNHGKPILCSAVSALVINTVNSIEAFTDEEITLKHNKDGLLYFELPRIKNGGNNKEAELLLSSLVLGLSGIINEYDGIEIVE